MKDSCAKSNLFFISAYKVTEQSTDMQKNECVEPALLDPKSKRSSMVMPAGNFNADAGELSSSEAFFDGRRPSSADRIGNEDRNP